MTGLVGAVPRSGTIIQPFVTGRRSPPPAAADSLAFIIDNKLWLANPDGSGAISCARLPVSATGERIRAERSSTVPPR